MEMRSGWLALRGVLGLWGLALLAVAIVAVGSPCLAHADRGEVLLQLHIGNEAARLRHPGVSYLGGGGDWAYVPRFGLAASYGVTHWLSLGLGVETSLLRDVTLHDATAQGYPAGNLDAGYLAVVVPASLGFRVVGGNPWSMLAVVSGGPAFTRWDARRLEDPAGMGTVPLVPFRDWYTEWFGRVAVQAELRSVDWGALSFGPYVGMSSVGDLSLGVVVESALIWGVGRYVVLDAGLH